MKTLEALHYEIIKSKSAMEKEMKRRWPIDSFVLVNLRSGQQIPTEGKVVGYYEEHVSVRISSAKEHSRRSVRSIYFKDMVS
jgi:hypothetical protein